MREAIASLGQKAVTTPSLICKLSDQEDSEPEKIVILEQTSDAGICPVTIRVQHIQDCLLTKAEGYSRI